MKFSTHWSDHHLLIQGLSTLLRCDLHVPDATNTCHLAVPGGFHVTRCHDALERTRKKHTGFSWMNQMVQNIKKIGRKNNWRTWENYQIRQISWQLGEFWDLAWPKQCIPWKSKWTIEKNRSLHQRLCFSVWNLHHPKFGHAYLISRLDFQGIYFGTTWAQNKISTLLPLSVPTLVKRCGWL